MTPVPVVLVIPPVAKPSEPTPGVLALAAHLGAGGVPVRVVDANLAFHEGLWDPRALDAARVRLQARAAPRALCTAALRAVRRVREAAADLRNPAAYGDRGRYLRALETLRSAYRAHGVDRGLRLSPSDLEHPRWSPLSSRALAAVAREPGALGLEDLLAPSVGHILSGDPGLVGISVTFLSQALAAFAMAGLLRRAGYRGLLVLGGALVGSWARHLTPGSEALAAWDAVVAGPGERALEALCRGGLDAPGVLAPARGVWRRPARLAPAPALPAEGADGLPWDRYLAPGPVVPLATSRGCYWRRCTFCPEHAQGDVRFRMHRGHAVARAVREAGDRTGARWFHLTDEAVPPATLRALARELEGGAAGWYGFVRPEPALLEPALCRAMARAGCTMLQVGVETLSQPLLDATGKGIRAEHAGPIVRNLAGAGIRTHVYLLFGLPGQSRRDAEEAVAWVRDHAAFITYLNAALFHLPRGSRLEEELAARGGLGPGDPARDLSLYRPFRPGGLWPRPAARRFLGALRSDPVIGPILSRTPPGFTANHAAFAPLDPPLNPPERV